MSSRKFRRTVMLALALSFGVAAMPSAAASQARGRTGPVIQGELSLRTLLQNIMETLRAVPVPKWNPGPPPGGDPGNQPPPGSIGREGSGMCPNGGGPRPGPGH